MKLAFGLPASYCGHWALWPYNLVHNEISFQLSAFGIQTIRSDHQWTQPAIKVDHEFSTSLCWYSVEPQIEKVADEIYFAWPYNAWIWLVGWNQSGSWQRVLPHGFTCKSSSPTYCYRRTTWTNMGRGQQEGYLPSNRLNGWWTQMDDERTINMDSSADKYCVSIVSMCFAEWWTATVYEFHATRTTPVDPSDIPTAADAYRSRDWSKWLWRTPSSHSNVIQ